MDIESYNAETEDTIKTSNEELLLQIEESRLNVKNVDDKLLNSISEVSKRINEETNEIIANHDIFRDEVEQKFSEVCQSSEERYIDISSQLKSFDDRREEYLENVFISHFPCNNSSI